MRGTRRAWLAGIGSVAAGGCLGSDSGNGGGENADDGPTTPAPGWYEATLTDVNTDEEFTLAGIADRPVLVEPFAVWCGNCLSQQKTMIDFHEQVGDTVHSVALNVDPNEDAAKVREHAESNGFDWRYAIAPPEVTESLKNQFGQDILVPPRVPMVLLCPDGTVDRLRNGHKEPPFLESAIGQCG
jgi:cytochrome oxidase Cu insertion factor (SCO1/SenC/PrrC family)